MPIQRPLTGPSRNEGFRDKLHQLRLFEIDSYGAPLLDFHLTPSWDLVGNLEGQMPSIHSLTWVDASLCALIVRR